MKTSFLILLLHLCIAPLVAHAAELKSIPFKTTTRKFATNDSIVIREVLATSPQMKVGDTVVVRGEYRVGSRSEAALGLFVTSTNRIATTIQPAQMVEINSKAGAFELRHTLTNEGRLHVSFYPRVSGASFGGVYFGSTGR